MDTDRTFLITCVVITHILAIMMGVFISFIGENVCRTEKCRNLSKDIREIMRDDINPCIDFYEFSCGNYKGDNDVLMDGTIDLYDKLIERLTVPSGRKEPRFITYRKNLMNQCLNDKGVEEMTKNLKSVIKLVGGFPTVDTQWWQEQEPAWTFEDSIKRFKDVGMFTNMIVDVSLTLSPFDKSQMVLISTSPQLVLSQCDADCQIRIYLKIALLLGADNNTAFNDIKDIISLELKLVEAMTSVELPQNYYDKNNFRSRGELVSKFDFLDWNNYLNSLFGRKKAMAKTSNFILLQNENYLLHLQSQFKIIDKRIIANYMIWYNLIIGFTYIPGMNHTSLQCAVLKETFAGTLRPISTYMVLQMRNEKGYSIISKMVGRIKNQLKISIDNLHWMDQMTKYKAKNKVKKMKSVVGYSKLFLDRKLIEDFYKGLTIGDNFLQSMLNLKKFDDQVLLERCYYGSLRDRYCQLYVESGSAPVDSVNAFYNLFKNLMYIPDPILKPPIFDPNWPEYINFGKIGMVVGHEMTHGFDNNGARFDSYGKIHDWWKPETKVKFTEKTKCFVDLFSSYPLNASNELIQVDGNLTLTENIADAGGLSLAFNAYRSLARDRFLPELNLPDMDYTHEQMFLIANAQLWCHGEISPEEAVEMVKDSHAPDPIRIRVGYQNFPFLGEIFGCFPGDPMNPTEKCKIW